MVTKHEMLGSQHFYDLWFCLLSSLEQVSGTLRHYDDGRCKAVTKP